MQLFEMTNELFQVMKNNLSEEDNCLQVTLSALFSDV